MARRKTSLLGRDSCQYTLADSYLHLSAQTAGGAADLAASRKEAKYSDLPGSYYTFQPLAFETLGPLNASSMAFVTELGRRLSESTDDPRETAFLYLPTSHVATSISHCSKV